MKLNPSEHFRRLVDKTVALTGLNFGNALRAVSKSNPDAATLMSAYGRTRQTVVLLNSRELQKITPGRSETRKQIAQFVNEKMQAGMSHPVAYNALAREHPELFGGLQFVNVTSNPLQRNKNSAGDPTPAQSGSTASAAGSVPVASPQMLALFRLPTNTSQAEFAAAWDGNGNTLAPINPAKIFAGLCTYWQKEKSLDYDQAIQECKQRYPDLWSFVELLAAQPV
jgi:hypothetical protein